MKLDWKSLNTEERIAVIRVGAAKKMSARQIAEEMENCTRNSIIGASHRYGIKLEGSSGVRAPKEQSPTPKTGLKTRPLAPLKYLKAKKPKGTKTVHTAALSDVDVPAEGSDWKELTREQKIAYVRAKAADGMTIAQVAGSLTNVAKDGIKSCARRYGIVFTGNSPEARSARSAERTGGIPRIKPKPLTWAEMSVEQKIAAIQKHIKAGNNAGDIADIYSVTENAVLKCCDRQKIKIKRRPKKYGVSIMEIGNHQCRAPLWKDGKQNEKRDISGYVFCGKPTKPGSSFCEACHAKFWQPARYEPRPTRREAYAGYGK